MRRFGGLGEILVRAAIAMSVAAPAHAQTVVPDEHAATQELLRQQERERALRRQIERTPDARVDGPAAVPVSERLPVDESPCFLIERIALGGDGAEQFGWALAAADVAPDGATDRATGRCLGAQGINLVMARIQNAIVAAGYVTTRVLAAS